jgi:hypothetical protein
LAEPNIDAFVALGAPLRFTEAGEYSSSEDISSTTLLSSSMFISESIASSAVCFSIQEDDRRTKGGPFVLVVVCEFVRLAENPRVPCLRAEALPFRELDFFVEGIVELVRI